MSYEKIHFYLAFLTLLGVLLKIVSYLYKGIKKEIKSIEEVKSKINFIFSEVTPNHGSSIKDKINKLEFSIQRNNELTEKIFSRQKWIMDHQEVAIFETNQNGEYIWVNNKLCKLFKRNIESFLGNSWKNSIYHEDRESVLEHWQNCLNDKIDFDCDFKIVDSENNIYNVKSSAVKTETGYIGSISVK
jgi:PAS domain-containing protein